MSKISGKNLIAETARGYWRQSAASATDFGHKYRHDPSFRTEVNTIGLQMAFTVVILAFLIIAFTYLYRDISLTVIQGIRQEILESPGSGMPPSLIGDRILSELEYIKTKNLLIAASGIIVATLLFGYVIARIILRPTRNALVSQKQFIGNIAHELRTPLSTIKTNTEVALFDPELSVDMVKILRSNIDELDRISDIINNLLSLNTFVRPEKVAFSEIDLGALAEAVVKKHTSLIERRNQVVKVHRKGPGKTWGNLTALEQVVTNLLKNAISYTPVGGAIDITVRPSEHPDHTDLEITDTGIGIAQKDLHRIFEPFFRAEQSRARRHGGSGLGLAIVNELVKLHHGKIRIKSALKHGTTVTISLPRQGAGGAERARHSRPDDAPEKHGEVSVDFTSSHRTKK